MLALIVVAPASESGGQPPVPDSAKIDETTSTEPPVSGDAAAADDSTSAPAPPVPGVPPKDNPADESTSLDGRVNRNAGISQDASADGHSHTHGHTSSPRADQELSQLERFLWWLGKFHPAAIAFPVGLIVATGLAELLYLTTRRPTFDAGSRFCMWLAGITSPIVAALGWSLSLHHPSGPAWVLETHQWLGSTTAAAAVIALLVLETSIHRHSRRLRKLYRVALLVTVGLVMGTGFFGGAMIYGVDHYRWPPAQPHGHADAAKPSSPEEVDAAVTVKMTDDFTYDPATVTIHVGQSVRWVNPSTVYHTVTADVERASDPASVQLPGEADPFDSGRILSGENYLHSFEHPGTYRYFCVPHEEAGMIGEVHVRTAD